ncbi:MAG: ABC transporter permease [Halodesulfurarchaeum sp.]
MSSRRFVLKRLILLVPVLLGVATVVFSILHLGSGDPAQVIAGRRASQAEVQHIREILGLNKPIWKQYLDFLADISPITITPAATFPFLDLHVGIDLGETFVIQRGTPVTKILKNRLPVTIELAIYGQFFGILFGIPLGIISAVKQDSVVDHLGRVAALSGISVPIFWSGPLLIMVFAVMLGWLPATGRIASAFSVPSYTGMITVDSFIQGVHLLLEGQSIGRAFDAFVSAVKHMLLPSLTIGIYSMALISRMMRSSMLEVIRQDYMRTARAKGQGAKITLMKHGLRNALIPVVTVIGIQFGTLLGGAVLTETVFGIHGIGQLVVTAIKATDYPAVQGTVLTFALLFTLVNLGVDITYSYLDPRIQQ